MLDVNRAVLHASATGRAIPQLGRGDDFADQRSFRPDSPAIAREVLALAHFAGEDVATIGGIPGDLQNEIARMKRLAGVKCWTVLQASPAVHTGVHVHQLGPVEVREGGDAK